MNDRFRFRAWDKEQKKMFYNAEMTYDYSLVLDACEADSFGTVLEDDKMVVMQCIGLKDKNGKLIYEGDILTNSRLKYLFVVKWDNSTAQFDPCVIRGIHPVHGMCSRFKYFPYEFYEVIGNIYENSELLE